MPASFPRLLALAVLALAAACQAPPPPSTSAPSETAAAHSDPGPTYSPWVVEVEAAYADMSTFDLISFKDVGLMSVPSPRREEAYETIARSLATELMSGGEVMSRVSFSSEQADPQHHLACGARQIYVDLWAGRQPARYGYSLWSGCSDEDRFAWSEVPRPEEDPAYGALATSIADALRSAMQTGCFQRHC
ncbi:MAG: hypothetical protein ACFCGT_23625 [Sandaracinaceae bacterium]